MGLNEKLRELYTVQKQLSRIIAELESLRGSRRKSSNQICKRLPRVYRYTRSVRGNCLIDAMDSAADVILIADDERRYVDFNRAAVEALDLPREEIVGRRIEDFFSMVQCDSVPTAWAGFIAEGEQGGLCELRVGARRRLFEYRAKANFRRGLHLSILREVTPDRRLLAR
jgi:PAS domain-containing protein